MLPQEQGVLFTAAVLALIFVSYGNATTPPMVYPTNLDQPNYPIPIPKDGNYYNYAYTIKKTLAPTIAFENYDAMKTAISEV